MKRIRLFLLLVCMVVTSLVAAPGAFGGKAPGGAIRPQRGLHLHQKSMALCYEIYCYGVYTRDCCGSEEYCLGVCDGACNVPEGTCIAT